MVVANHRHPAFHVSKARLSHQRAASENPKRGPVFGHDVALSVRADSVAEIPSAMARKVVKVMETTYPLGALAAIVRAGGKPGANSVN